MVTNELLSRGDVIVNGDAVRARQVANQIALRDAVEKYGVSKIFTFHRTVKSAASFVAEGNEGIRTHLPGFGAFHVNGDMPTARRERVMREFRGATQAAMSNARCLTEGVDVPAVDMVAFLSPRRSRVDIVQATGRAMRRAPGKALGYVLVPLYVELAAGESVDDAVSRADFDEVWDVLQSLQEQDEALADLIRHFGEQKGRGKGFDDRGFADRIDFGGPRLSLENLRTAVTTRCLEKLYSSWDTWFGKLTEFRKRFEHCNVEAGWKENPSLGGWVSAQRGRRKKGALGDDQIRRLDELGFVWDYQRVKAQETWCKWYRELEAYTREHGNPHVPRTYSNTKLASWVWIQRQRKKGTFKRKGENSDPMTPEQERLLDKLRFRWGQHEDKSKEQFEQLKPRHYLSELIDRVRAIIACGAGTRAEMARWVLPERTYEAAKSGAGAWLAGITAPNGESTLRIQAWVAVKTLEIDAAGEDMRAAYRTALSKTKTGNKKVTKT